MRRAALPSMPSMLRPHDANFYACYVRDPDGNSYPPSASGRNRQAATCALGRNGLFERLTDRWDARPEVVRYGIESVGRANGTPRHRPDRALDPSVIRLDTNIQTVLLSCGPLSASFHVLPFGGRAARGGTDAKVFILGYHRPIDLLVHLINLCFSSE